MIKELKKVSRAGSLIQKLEAAFGREDLDPEEEEPENSPEDDEEGEEEPEEDDETVGTTKDGELKKYAFQTKRMDDD